MRSPADGLQDAGPLERLPGPGRMWLTQSSTPWSARRPWRPSSISTTGTSTSGVSDRSSSTTEQGGSTSATACRMPSRTEAALAKKSISSGRTMTRPGTADSGAVRRSRGSSPPLARPRNVRRGSLARQMRTPSEATHGDAQRLQGGHDQDAHEGDHGQPEVGPPQLPELAHLADLHHAQ